MRVWGVGMERGGGMSEVELEGLLAVFWGGEGGVLRG